MALPIERFTLGVEEEYQIVDGTTLALAGRQADVLPRAERELGSAVAPELQQSMIEIATPICSTLADVRRELERARKRVVSAARERGSRIAAQGTHPFSDWREQTITKKPRYREIKAMYGLIANETVVCGCHVHVALPGRDVAIDAMSRVRSQLAPLLALSANSPYWLGTDSHYASFRTEIWSRWPTAGPPLGFDSEGEYDDLVAALVRSGVVEDETKLYWDVRPSCRFPTLEFRVADVAMTIDGAVLLAGLARALARSAYLAGDRGEAVPAARHEVVRAAHWHAARYGLDGELVDARTGERAPARQVVEALLVQLRDALEEAGDYEEVAALARDVLQGGTGAKRQREVFKRTGDLRDVVAYVVAKTEA